MIVITKPEEMPQEKARRNRFPGDCSGYGIGHVHLNQALDAQRETDGPAVFKARGMYLMAGGMPKVAWENCNGEKKVEGRTREADDIATVPVVTVYPNPAQSLLYVQTNLPERPYRVYNMLGAVVMEGHLATQLTTLSIDQLQSGLYFIVVEGALQPVKFVVSQ